MTEAVSRWVLATGNTGKLREMADLLGPMGVVLQAQSDFDTPDAEETGLTFIENAIIKARNACEHSGLPSIADDSGLEVDFLQGRPGIYSARFSGPEATDAENNRALLEAMQDVPERLRTARFRCCMVYMRHALDPSPIIASGAMEGVILDAEQGQGGFGYDPLFYIPAHHCAAAELSKDEKNKISHRGQAMSRLMEQLQQPKEA